MSHWQAEVHCANGATMLIGVEAADAAGAFAGVLLRGGPPVLGGQVILDEIKPKCWIHKVRDQCSQEGEMYDRGPHSG